MAQQWTPPSIGSPCWINVFATDVPRAKKFYATALDWKFREGEHHGQPEDPEHIAHFELGKSCPGGGITKVNAAEFVKGGGHGGAVLYLWVDDLKKYMDRIVQAGGRKLSDPEPEGNTGMMQTFEDTEGNFVGLYTLK